MPDRGVGAIVQARMGSTRLPGKALADVCGMPMLARVVHRTRQASRVDAIVVATSDQPADEPIVATARALGVDVFRGDETDVLDRYYQAARANGFDVVVRITSDCPLIDPGLIDRVVELVLDGDGRIDYAANTLRRTFPRGLDTQVAPFPALERIWREATSTFDRAHVFPYAYEHPEAFVLAGITNAVDLSGLRWTVDEEEDLAFVREVYRRLGRPDAPWTEVAALVQSHPELTAINAAVCQKTARQA